MKSRLAATAVLMLVFALVIAAPSFAVSGSSSSGSAASAQYPQFDPSNEIHIPPTPPNHTVPPSPETQNSALPFTGYAAIPVLLGGIALMGGGLLIRRRTRRGLDS
jgi:hypothetical protein